MPGLNDLIVFVTAGILLNLTPGQDTMYILSRSVSQGRRAGVLSALGVSTGGAIHTVAAALGLSAVLASSAGLFLLVKSAGAIYLVYLGVRMFLQARPGHQEAGCPACRWTSWQIYRQGVATNLLNPKVALFFVAFLPQFVSADCSNQVVPFLLLGGIFLFTGTLWCLISAVLSASITTALRSSPRAARLMNRLCGGVLVGLGIKLAFARSR